MAPFSARSTDEAGSGPKADRKGLQQVNEDQLTAIERYAAWTLEDAQLRLQYQHEYTLAGLKALILINGGAIIALLTYAGHTASAATAGKLEGAFGLYVAGLALGVLAYVAAYISQSQLMNHSTLEAQRMLGLSAPGGRTSTSYEKAGTRAVYFGIAFAVFSLTSFAGGSMYALKAVAHHTESPLVELGLDQ